MDKTLKSIQDFLQKNERYVIYVTDLETGNTLVPKVTMQQILNEHLSIEKFFVYVVTKFNTNKVGVQKKRPNGSSYSNVGSLITLPFEIKNKPLVEAAANGVPVNPVVAPAAANYQQQMPQPKVYQAEPYQQQNQQSMGLNAVQIAEGMMAKNKVELQQERIDGLKERIVELKALLKSQNDKNEALLKSEKNRNEELVTKLREALADLSIAEKQMNFAIDVEKSKKTDPEVIKKGMEMGTQLLETFVAGKMASPAAQQTGLGASLENLSDSKQNIINTITPETFPENYANFLYKIIYGFNKPEFLTELENLVTKHGL